MKMGEDNAIIISPEYDGLIKETEKLKTELSMLILERDNLRSVELPNIEAA